MRFSAPLTLVPGFSVPGFSVTGFLLSTLLLGCFATGANGQEGGTRQRGAPSDSSASPLAREGELDLRGWLPGRDGPVELAGEWRFAWKELVPPGGSCSAERYGDLAALPGVWNEMSRNGELLPASGHATYCLNVTLHRPETPLLLEIGRVRTSGTLWVNGRLAAELGSVGTTPETSRPRRVDRVVAVPAEEELVIVLQVSNYHFRAGGSHRPIRLGRAADLEPVVQNFEASVTMFFVGAFAILGLYHLFIFGIRRAGQEPLFFGLLCLAMAGYQLTRENSLFAALFPFLLWTTELRLEYTLFAASVALGALYVGKTYPREFSTLFVRGCAGTSAVFVLATWVLPTRVVSDQVLATYQVAFLAAGVVGVWGLTRALRNRRPGALLFAIGGSLWVISGLTDGLVLRFFPDGPRLLPYGFMALIVAQAVLLAIIQIRATNRAEELSTRLLGLASEKLALEQMAYRDPLTGLENRRRLQQGAHKLRSQLDSGDVALEPDTTTAPDDDLESGAPRHPDDTRNALVVSLLFFDIDDFKTINDQWGHDMGDAVLVAVADLIRDTFRSHDLSVRLGGDEFAVLLAGVDEPEARRQASRLGRRLDEPIDVNGNQLHIAISIGVASASGQHLDVADLLTRADHDMYKAKSGNKLIKGLRRNPRSHVGAIT